MASFAQPARASPRYSASRRHTDQPTQASSSRGLLPEGSCNYKNLNGGGDQPTCGCRRFWETGVANTCVCGHHACFHDEVELSRSSGNLHRLSGVSTPQQELTGFPVPGQVNLLRPGSSQARDVTSSEQSSSGLPPIPDICLISNEKKRSRKSHQDGNVHLAGLGLTVQSSLDLSKRHPSPSPTITDPIDFNAIQYLDPDLPSTRQSSTTDDERPNVSPDPAFMESVMQNRAITGPPLEISNVDAAKIAYEDFVQSPTEVATPSVAATPDFKALDQLVQDTRGLADVLNRTRQAIGNAAEPSRDSPMTAMTPRPDGSRPKKSASPANRSSPYREALKKLPSTLQQLLPHLNTLNTQLSTISNLSVSINSLTGRINALERASFDYVSPTEIHDKLEPIDTRLFEAEERLDDHGRRLQAVEVEVNGSAHGLFTSNGGSFVSTRLNEAEIRLKELQDQLNDLQSSLLPSLASPWVVEVVLLPWGRELKGVWAPSEELDRPGSKTTTQRSEEWSDTRALRATSSSFHSVGEAAWSKDAIHQWMDEAHEWLFPKACGPNNIVYQRLKSRGFVHEVEVTGSESNDVQLAICRTFNSILRAIRSNKFEGPDERTSADEVDNKRFLGLTAPFIPLRKVHRSSKLRFLMPSEMVSPALWTATFLASNLFMKAAGGQKRLFITTREGYLQGSEKQSSSWTWSKLRDLSRIAEDADTPIISHVPETSTQEACWVHHPELDAPSSQYSSFHSQLSASAARAQPTLSALQPHSAPSEHSLHDLRSDTATHPLHPITPTSEIPYPRTRSQHRRHRTVSVPLSDAPSSLIPEAQQAKRRVRSFETSNNPLIDKIPSYIPSPAKSRSRKEKRRRITRSRSASNRSESVEHGNEDDIIEQHIAYLETGDDRALQGFGLTPRRSWEPVSLQVHEERESAYKGSDDGRVASGRASQGVAAVHALTAAVGDGGKRASTPGVYMTPFSGTFVPAGPSSAGLVSEQGHREDEEDGEGWNGLDGDEHEHGRDEGDEMAGDEEEDYDSILEDEGDDRDSDMDCQE